MERKKKVLFVGSFKEKAADGSVGGQMFACRTLIYSNLKDKIDFILIDSTAASVPVPPPYKRAWKALKRVFIFAGKLLFNKIDTVIIFSADGWSLKEKGLMVIIAKLFSVKIIFAPRSGLILGEVARSSFTRHLLQRTLRRADIVICQGNTWRDFYIQFQPEKPEKFKVVINWIDTEKYRLVYQQRQAKQSSGNGTMKLLFLGWLEAYKGISELLQTFDKLLNAGYKLEADIYGAGSLGDEIALKVKTLGIEDKFRLRGWADEATKLKALAETDIFVLPSFVEGIPNALIEAMACGLPCIGTTVGGIPDLIQSGTNGLIFNAGNVDELYQCIALFYENESQRNALGLKAYEFVHANCSIEYAVNYFGTIL
jgi:glycosyltransferase involved in cell wall biosynthesis